MGAVQVGTGVKVRNVELKFEDQFAVDLTSLEKCLTAKTKLVSLATPQNPSGVATPAETIDALLQRIDQVAPSAYLFLDETYRFATYGEADPAKSFASHHPRIITGASVSKAFGAPGLRMGWLTANNPDIIDRLKTAKMNIVISGSPLDECLAAHLLAKKDVILAPRRATLKAALCLLERWLDDERERLDWVRPNAGALCSIRLKDN